MIAKQTYGLSPKLTVAINGVPVDYLALNEVALHLEVGLHDMLVLRMSGIPPRAMVEYRNRPVFCSMDLSGGMTASFYGYVIDVRAVSATSGGVLNGSPFQDAYIYCMGTSYDMRGGDSRVWQNARLQDVAEELSVKYGFSMDVPFDDLILSPMLQDNESDWQFLTRYATALGYETTLHGTHLHIFDPYKAYTRGTSFHRLYTGQQVQAGLTPQPGQIATFDVSLAEHHPDGVYKDTTIAVHQDDNTIYEVSLRALRGLTAPARFTNRLRDSVDNFTQAVRAIDVETKEHYDYTATATTLAVPGCKPGGLVEVDSYGTDSIDGLWYVKAVKHTLHSSAFVSDLTLVRNINSELVPTSVAVFQAPPAPKLVNDRWISSKRLTNAYT